MAVKELNIIRDEFKKGDIPNDTKIVDLIDSINDNLKGDYKIISGVLRYNGKSFEILCSEGNSQINIDRLKSSSNNVDVTFNNNLMTTVFTPNNNFKDIYKVENERKRDNITKSKVTKEFKDLILSGLGSMTGALNNSVIDFKLLQSNTRGEDLDILDLTHFCYEDKDFDITKEYIYFFTIAKI